MSCAIIGQTLPEFSAFCKWKMEEMFLLVSMLADASRRFLLVDKWSNLYNANCRVPGRLKLRLISGVVGILSLPLGNGQMYVACGCTSDWILLIFLWGWGEFKIRFKQTYKTLIMSIHTFLQIYSFWQAHCFWQVYGFWQMYCFLQVPACCFCQMYCFDMCTAVDTYWYTAFEMYRFC